ncbi:molybdopterin converting factor, subunit 1 [Methylophaga frappieri]|uniref:Molybdopterin synthase sulfur carrier subunit n=1 Tax=Methylophaga frappieri (strain ATCC BAA-2434 / DSM 25690 / JAM7) TaxID=754477 RepID=I1YI68_METFJ|nr:MoaD/ThiS family protein [Methylophaga frappieri]AFJ02611.1 molybdopterin converting factor, subunit 1 [Methylophaga frappieri]
MTIQVKFFASLREQLDISEITIPAVETVSEAWDNATNNASKPANLLVAVNLDYATLNSPVKDGDEVAFFPPVTGG